MSLERLEAMNRRAVTLAFPLLTVGLLVGVVLLAQRDEPPAAWATAKVVSTAGLWVAFGVLLYLRYGAAVSGRRLALLTIAAFCLLLAALAAPHSLAGGAGS